MTVQTASARGCGGGCGGGADGGRALSAPGFGGLVRPRFFAGQLLDEEDLRQLDAATVTRARLHNRYLYGAGVVCGLAVRCDPCGGGTAEVGPGYALDGCGADIVVDEPVRLNVVALARELRATLLGRDCPDPCADPTADATTVATTDAGGTSSDGTGAGEVPTARYLLAIRYAERTSDPVTPYLTGEPYSPDRCEPTRVREGYQFVLRPYRASGPGSGDAGSGRGCGCGCGCGAGRSGGLAERLELCERLDANGEPAPDLRALGRELLAAAEQESNPEHIGVAWARDATLDGLRWLLDRVSRDAWSTDCGLRADAERVRVPQLPEGRDSGEIGWDPPLLRAVGEFAGTVGTLIHRYSLACSCAALNPPCPPVCADPDVPLALVEMRDCKVVRICMSVRDLVVTGPALRYGLPVGGLPARDGNGTAAVVAELRTRVAELAAELSETRQALATERDRVARLWDEVRPNGGPT